MDNCNPADLRQNQGCRVVLFPLPFQGHINPMIQLANILHSNGFSISIVHTRYNFPNPSKYPHFTFHRISDDLPEDETSITDVILRIKLLITNCEEPFLQCLARLLSDGTNCRVKCIVTDALWYFTQAAADKFNLPRIVLRTSSVCSFLAFSAFPLLRKQGYFANRESKMEAPIEGLPPLKVKDIPTIEMHNPEDLYEIVDNMVEKSKEGSGLILNTFEELEGPELARLHEQMLVPIFAIGPFHKFFSAATSSLLTQDRSSLSWLDKQAPKSVLYVSFGSMAAMDRQKTDEVAWGLANSMQPLAWGLANSMQPFLWVVRPRSVHGSEWLEMLPNEFLSSVSERSYIVKWAPQQEVLSHPAIGGFWTHSGWNSTLESICEGVPMICSPFFGDQMVNSRYASDVWRIGIKLEKGLERGEIEDAIRKLMVGREAEEMRERVVFLKANVDLCTNSGGSSHQELDGLINLISSFKSSV